jgi:hypothetical protein
MRLFWTALLVARAVLIETKMFVRNRRVAARVISA